MSKDRQITMKNEALLKKSVTPTKSLRNRNKFQKHPKSKKPNNKRMSPSNKVYWSVMPRK